MASVVKLKYAILVLYIMFAGEFILITKMLTGYSENREPFYHYTCTPNREKRY